MHAVYFWVPAAIQFQIKLQVMLETTAECRLGLLTSAVYAGTLLGEVIVMLELFYSFLKLQKQEELLQKSAVLGEKTS